MYADGRFARHPRFRYFALNTEMRWRALQAGRIYVRHHPHDAQLFFVLTWLLFISTIIVLLSQALRRNVMFTQARPPQCPAFRLVIKLQVFYTPIMTTWYVNHYNWGEPERAPHSRDLHHFFMSYVRTYVRTSVCTVDPIAYSRISTWKTGILRARARTPDTTLHIAPRHVPARTLDLAGLRLRAS